MLLKMKKSLLFFIFNLQLFLIFFKLWKNSLLTRYSVKLAQFFYSICQTRLSRPFCQSIVWWDL